MTQSKKGLISIDIARAFAALCVFSYHQHLGLLLAKYTGINAFNFPDLLGAFYTVPLFFLISGYCIHLSNLKYINESRSLPIGDYYKKRLLRIYPPYLMALLFSIAVNYIIQPASPLIIKDFFVHLFLLQGFSSTYFNTINVVLWTISIELAFYILYPIFYYIRLKYSLKKALLFTFIVSCISTAYFTTKTNITSPQFYCVLNLWFAWCCGAYMAETKVLKEVAFSRSVYKIFYAIVVMLFVSRFFYSPGYWNIAAYQVNILIWTAPLLFLINREHWLSQNRSIFVNVMVSIGLSSYSLYLLHEPLINLKNFLAHTYLPQNFQFAGVLTGVFLIPFVAWLSYLYIEKPFMAKKRE